MSNSPERREIRFATLDEAVADAEQLASGEVRTTGNHSFGQILRHLALTKDLCMGKVTGPPIPWYMRLMIPIMRPMLLNDKPLKPGFKLPAKGEKFFWPDRELDVQEALAHFKGSVKEYNAMATLPKHPVFGNLTREQNESMNCRHCALHLSFVHPVT